jgi:hypothetical protein
MFIRLNVPPRSGHQITSDGVLRPWRPGQFQRSHRRRSIAPSPPFTPSIPHLSHTRSIVASCAVSKARPRTSQRTGAGGITVLLRRAAYRPHVDAGRMHGDQHLTGDGKRRLDVVGRKNILAAEAVDARLMIGDIDGLPGLPTNCGAAPSFRQTQGSGPAISLRSLLG